MGVIDIIKSFEKETGVDIFRAIEEEGILLGMGFISSELELAEQLNNDLTYINKVEKLRDVYFKRRVTKKFALTDREVEVAIKQSLQNSTVGVMIFRKEFRYSEWLLSNAEAKNICQKYDNVLNPLFYLVNEGTDGILAKSMFEGGDLQLSSYGVRNGFDGFGIQKYRGVIPLAKKGMYYIMNADKVNKSMYHPVVWFLLLNHGIETYLTSELKLKIKEHLEMLRLKQLLVINKVQLCETKPRN